MEPNHIPVRDQSTIGTSDPSKRFMEPEESEFRDLVYDSLANIIQTNVAALTYNALFGQLWRAVCKYTGDPARKAELVNAFSVAVGKIRGADQKAALRQWLEESFDMTEEIEGIIKRHYDEMGSQLELVYLDLDADIQLTRTELLEVSRSCYSGVIKRIARVFTHLKLVEPGVTLAPRQRSLPLSLPANDFFRLLPHLIVPGTMYSSRASALTAVVALTTGVPFLQTIASTFLSTSFKGKWINLNIPENISFDCAQFLLTSPEGVVLTAQERKLYEAMRRYRLLELNLDAPIEAKVPWTPQKSRGPGGVKVQCSRCQVRRSVTIMSHLPGGLCGFCVGTTLSGKRIAELYPQIDDPESCWVQCSAKICRAQYVVERVDSLQRSPRCYYCRNNTPCPALECSICTNRIIVPNLYRSASDKQKYTCPGCLDADWSNKTVVSTETTVRALNQENKVQWLGFTAADNERVFLGKSAFKLMQAFDQSVFGKPITGSSQLTLAGKQVQNVASILWQVEERVGRGEVVLAYCALCFEEKAKSKLMPACGRSGCAQLVDEACLPSQYGGNRPGKLLNMAQFTCPFCRRKPTLKTMMRYNAPAASLGSLARAMDDRRFLYAWCLDCGHAQVAYERVCCTEETLPPIENFRCEDCQPPPAETAAPRERRVRPREQQTSTKYLRKLMEGKRACPNSSCGLLIEKVDGCNHMRCVCGTHFCWECGKAVGEGRIYSHMSTEHNSWWEEIE